MKQNHLRTILYLKTSSTNLQSHDFALSLFQLYVPNSRSSREVYSQYWFPSYKGQLLTSDAKVDVEIESTFHYTIRLTPYPTYAQHDECKLGLDRCPTKGLLSGRFDNFLTANQGLTNTRVGSKQSKQAAASELACLLSSAIVN